MKLPHRSALFSALLLGLSAQSSAATITFAGFIEGSVVNDWRTAAASKSGLDIDGDNVLGSTLGALNWGLPTAGQTTVASGSFGWSYVSDTGNGPGGPGFATIDDISNPVSDVFAGIGAFGNQGAGNTGQFTFGLEGSALNYTGKTVRVGIMKDILDGVFYYIDSPNSTLQLVGPGGDSGVISLRGGSVGDAVAEMYFFDITGVNPGDQFSILTTSNGDQVNYIGPVSWDISEGTEIPFGVDSTLGLAVLGALGALRLRRRRSV